VRDSKKNKRGNSEGKVRDQAGRIFKTLLRRLKRKQSWGVGSVVNRLGPNKVHSACSDRKKKKKKKSRDKDRKIFESETELLASNRKKKSQPKRDLHLDLCWRMVGGKGGNRGTPEGETEESPRSESGQ